MALAKHIEAGKAYAGLLIDGVEGTPYVVATLTLTEETGLLVEVPYTTANDADQFRSVEDWFESRNLPEAFQFRGDELEMTLYGCRMSGRTRHFGRELAVGRFIAESAVVGRRELSRAFDVEVVRSRVDGLREWTGFTATEVEHDVDEHAIIHGVTIRVRSTSELTWRHGDAAMMLSTDWEGMEGETGAHIDEWVTLSSSFDPPRPPDAHVEAQKAVRDLLVLNFGTPLRFRRHALRDSSMPSPQYEEGEPVHLPFRELLIRETTWDHFRPDVEKRALRRPIGWAGDYSAEALEAWPDLHLRWARAVQPLVSLLNREWFTPEDVVLGANISLEASGHLLEPVPGEEETYRNPAKPRQPRRRRECCEHCVPYQRIGRALASLTWVSHGSSRTPTTRSSTTTDRRRKTRTTSASWQTSRNWSRGWQSSRNYQGPASSSRPTSRITSSPG